MLTRLDIVTPAATTPVDVNLVRQHARIDNSDDDIILGLYISTATALTEAYLNRTLITTSYLYTVAETEPPNSGWPLVPSPIFVLPLGVQWLVSHMTQHAIELPRAPIQAVSAVTIGQWGQDDTALVEDTDYFVDLTIGRIRMQTEMPVDEKDHLSFAYTAGYGTNPADIPVAIRHAVMLLSTALYEHRGDDGGDLPDAAYHLLDPYRMMAFGRA